MIWGSAPVLAVATVLVLNMLSTGIHVENDMNIPDGQVQVQEPEGVQEKGGGNVAGIASEPGDAGRMFVNEPSQILPVETNEGEQYMMFALPYMAGAVAASLSFIIIRRRLSMR